MPTKPLLPTFSRYEKVDRIIRGDAALSSRLSSPAVQVVKPGDGGSALFSQEIVDVTLALHKRNVDIHRASTTDIMREAINHIDLEKAAPATPAAANGKATASAPKSSRKKAAARPSRTAAVVARARATLPPPPKAARTRTPAARPPATAAPPREQNEMLDKANVYVAAYSNLAYTYAMLEKWDDKPGHEKRLADVRKPMLEVKKLASETLG